MISNSITTKLKASKSFQQDNKSTVTVTEDDETIEDESKTDKDHANHVTNHVMVFSPRTKVRGLLEFRPGIVQLFYLFSIWHDLNLTCKVA